jgi:DNA-binding GntR family transcriptional regulator
MIKENLKEKAYSIIKKKIINCEYQPGSFLNEADLMKEIGASRTPIREALNKLEQENLIKIIAKRGVLVCEISMNEINDVYQTRELIEPYIIRVWGSKLDKKTLLEYREKLVKLSSSLTEAEIYKIDDDLHRHILSACENKYLTQIMSISYDQNHRIRIISGKTKRRLEVTNEEHVNILNALIEDDLNAAAEAMTVHLENARKAAAESIFNI